MKPKHDNSTNDGFKFDYFISYAHGDDLPNDGDVGFVENFVDALRKNAKQRAMFGEAPRVFYDKTSLKGMEDWNAKIRAALASSRFLIVMISPYYFKSEFCAREFEWRLAHESFRFVLSEGTAPFQIANVGGLYDFQTAALSDVPVELRRRYPNWVARLRQYQSVPEFDLRELARAKINDAIVALKTTIEDKLDKQRRSTRSRRGADYPAHNVDFVGRREELRFLRDALTVDKSAVVCGFGGFGKTELALTYGHAFSWDYELGRLFVRCENQSSLAVALLTSGLESLAGISNPRGSETERLTAVDSALRQKRASILAKNHRLAQKLASNRDSDSTPTDVERGAKLYVVLDNVENPELLSRRNFDSLPDYFRVVVTTRMPENMFSQTVRRTLGELSVDESVELLNNLRPFGWDEKEAAAAREIAELLAGYPLAVELTGAYLRAQKHLSYRRRADRLRTDLKGALDEEARKPGVDLARRRRESLESTLESTFAALSNAARTVLRYVAATSPDAVPLPWLGEFAKLSEDDAEDALAELTSYSLLTPLEETPQLARIHRLIVANCRIPSKEIVDAERETLVRLETLAKTDAKRWIRTREFDWELAAMEAFCQNQAEKDEKNAANDEIARRSLGLLYDLTRKEFNRGWYLRSEKCGELGLAWTLRRIERNSTRIDEYALPVAELLRLVGVARLRNNRYLRAEKDLLEALTNFRKLERKYSSRPRLSWILLRKSNPRATIRCATALTLGALADLHTVNKQFDLAEKEYDEALKISKQFTRRAPDVWAKTLLGIAEFHIRVGREKLAEKELLETVRIRKRLAKKDSEYRLVLAYALEKLGSLYCDTDRAALAEQHFNEALEIFQDVALKYPGANVDSYTAWGLRNLAILYSRTGRSDLSEEYFKEAIKLHRKIMSRDADAERSNLVETLKRVSIFHKKNGREDLAERELNEALEIERKLFLEAPDAFRSGLATSLLDVVNMREIKSDASGATETETALLEAIELNREEARRNPNRRREVVRALYSLAVWHNENGRVDLAEKEYLDALAVNDAIDSEPREQFTFAASAWHCLSILYRNDGRDDLADAALDKENEAVEKLFATLHKNS